MQWRILLFWQLFPENCAKFFKIGPRGGGGRASLASGGSIILSRRGDNPGGALTYDFVNFSQNCMKLKEFGPPREARPTRPLRSANSSAPPPPPQSADMGWLVSIAEFAANGRSRMVRSGEAGDCFTYSSFLINLPMDL